MKWLGRKEDREGAQQQVISRWLAFLPAVCAANPWWPFGPIILERRLLCTRPLHPNPGSEPAVGGAYGAFATGDGPIPNLTVRRNKHRTAKRVSVGKGQPCTSAMKVHGWPDRATTIATTTIAQENSDGLERNTNPASRVHSSPLQREHWWSHRRRSCAKWVCGIDCCSEREEVEWQPHCKEKVPFASSDKTKLEGVGIMGMLPFN
jgi:hypothetical protein